MQEVPVGLKGDAAVISVIALFAAAVEQHAIGRLFAKDTEARFRNLSEAGLHDLYSLLRSLRIPSGSGVSDGAVCPRYSILSKRWNYAELQHASHVVR